jgi:tyrosyl-tRNA synthetase
LTPATVTNHLAAMRRQFRRHILDRLRDLTTSDDEFEAEARRLLGGGGVKLNGEPLAPEELDLGRVRLAGAILQIGKRRFVRLVDGSDA